MSKRFKSILVWFHWGVLLAIFMVGGLCGQVIMGELFQSHWKNIDYFYRQLAKCNNFIRDDIKNLTGMQDRLQFEEQVFNERIDEWNKTHKDKFRRFE